MLTRLIIILSIILAPELAFAATNLPVPFTSQAPEHNWNQPWQDTCEETAVVMVDYFYSGKEDKTIDVANAKKDILHAYNVKTKVYGWSLDENAQKIVNLINNYYDWEAQVVLNPTIETIKLEIDNGNPVILPVHGRSLLNPYFTGGGPDYHMLVISGYDDESDEFITQEPGTRHGLDFRYSYDRLFIAMHDYLPGWRTRYGEKIAIFTSPQVNASATLDGDDDGLTKVDEIKIGTKLWLSDTDSDSHTDGDEFRSGYSPTVAEDKLQNGSLVKGPDRAEVYVVSNGTKAHIATEEEFIQRGFKWSNIVAVSGKFINQLRSI